MGGQVRPMHELFRYTPRWVVAPLRGVLWLAVALACIAIVEAVGGSLPLAAGVVAVTYCILRIRSYPKYKTRRPPVVFEPVQSVWLSLLLLAAAVAFIATVGSDTGSLRPGIPALSAVLTLALLWLVQDIIVRRNTYRFPRADGWRVFVWDAALRLSFLPVVYVLAAADAPAWGVDIAERLTILLPFVITATYVLLAQFRTAAFDRKGPGIAVVVDRLLPQPRWWPDRECNGDATDAASVNRSGKPPESSNSVASVDSDDRLSGTTDPESAASGAVRYRQSHVSQSSTRRFERAVRAIEVTSSTCSLAGMLFGTVQFLI